MKFYDEEQSFTLWCVSLGEAQHACDVIGAMIDRAIHEEADTAKEQP